MKYHKLHIVGFTGTEGNRLNNYIGTILDKGGNPVYNLNEETLRLEECTMAENVPLLAADGATIVSKTYNVDPMSKQSSRNARSFDISFTLGDDLKEVCAVRLNEPALRELWDSIDKAMHSDSTN